MGTQAFNADTGVSVGSSANLVIDANRNANFANIDANNFIGSGNLTSSNAHIIGTAVIDGSTDFNPPTSVEYLVVAGGGGGAAQYAGGGGGGGLLTGSAAISSGTYSITIGAGGAGGIYNSTEQGSNGANSIVSGTGFSTITSVGGGGGAPGGGGAGGNGGSGGGTGINNGSSPGKGIYPGSTYISAARQGYDGSGYGDGTGGGGAGQVGQGDAGGGSGLASSISGASTYYAGGGGGWGRDGLEPGGVGGGGNGGYGSVPPTAGAANTGGGGGGGMAPNQVSPNGAAGGSGIVIIRYLDTYSAAATFTGATVTVAGGYRIYTFTTSGSITFGGTVNSTSTTTGTLIVSGGVGIAKDVFIGGNLTSSNLVNFSSASNVALGNVSNVHITGGSNGYVLSTDGTGNLSWAAGGGGGGASLNVSEYTTGNLSNTVANVGNLLFDTTTGFSVTNLGNGNALIQLGSSFKTWQVTGQTSLVAVGEDTVQFIAGSGITITTNASVIPQQITFSANLGNISDNEISNGTSNVSIPTANGNVFISVNGNANVAVVTGTGANINGTLTVSNTVTISNTAGGATNIALGSPSQGNLVSNAISFTTDSTVSNAIAQLNTVLGKLVPPSPPNFPASQSVTINSLSSYRMANYVQTDNTPGANKSVAGGTTVSTVTRLATYATSNIANAGPGDSGTIVAYLNGSNAGGRTLTTSLNGNGTYSNLVIFNNVDYNTVNANIAAGFWSVFSSRAAGTITQGWNEVYIADSATSNTNTANWFYDSSSPGTPTFSTLAITAPVSPTYTYSSTVPHYANTNNFTIGFNCTRLSGNMYPVSDTFVTGTAGGAFAAPTSVTYATAGVTTPLAQNLYVSSGSQAVSTTSSIISGFGASTIGPNVNVLNSYATGTQSFTTTLGANVLYKTGTVSSASVIQEANVYIGSTIGVGSGLAFRILNPGASNTPYFTGNETAFDSQSSLLRVYDATVVANVLKHDQTNYSTGYLPVGPDLSSGRSGTQYFTFKVVRTSVSKFDVGWSGNIAGLWVALPGSTIDNTSTANGWLDMTVSYAGAGVPGANVAAGGNGSDGSALGGTAPINTVQTNKFVTATFGTVSSSSTAQNEIYLRVGLTSGQTVTALSLRAASN